MRILEENVYIRDPKVSEDDFLKQKEKELNEFFQKLDASSVLPEDISEELYVFFPLQLENGEIVIEKLRDDDELAGIIKKDPHKLRTVEEIEKIKGSLKGNGKVALVEKQKKEEEDFTSYEETMKELNKGTKGIVSMNLRNAKGGSKRNTDKGEFAFDDEESEDSDSD